MQSPKNNHQLVITVNPVHRSVTQILRTRSASPNAAFLQRMRKKWPLLATTITRPFTACAKLRRRKFQVR